jgi:ankyrin repeat protein
MSQYPFAMTSEEIDALKEMIDYLLDPSSPHKERLINALFTACMWSFDDIFVKLLTAGANINAVNEYGDTPLHIAAEGLGSIETIQILLDCGADITLVNKHGKTAYMVAIESDNGEAAEYLK